MTCVKKINNVNATPVFGYFSDHTDSIGIQYIREQVEYVSVLLAWINASNEQCRYWLDAELCWAYSSIRWCHVNFTGYIVFNLTNIVSGNQHCLWYMLWK